MSILSANPFNVAKRCRQLRAGDTLVLKKGVYDKPLIVTGLAGTATRPVTIEAEKGAVFTSGMSLKKYTRQANLIAMRRQAAGHHPGLGQSADEAVLSFVHCRHVIVRRVTFRRCWPTAVHLEECQHITLEGLKIREGTIAIGASGSTTRDLTICGCDWRQDVSPGHDMWNSVPWKAIHGSRDNGGDRVDLKHDLRAWDGGFFRASDVAGNIVLRDNRISDAFNAIHVFNRIDRPAAGVDPKRLRRGEDRRASANMLIENNTFTRIRNNAIEPEDFAWNWVIRHNVFADCYRPFSLELNRAGWFYIYGNYASLNNRPGLASDEPDRNSCSHFRLGGQQKNDGCFHVFLNSWYYDDGEGIFPQGVLSRLRHHNNAIGFGRPDRAGMFGETDHLPVAFRTGATALTADNLKRHFTRRWGEDQFDIVFDGDIAEDENFPENFRELGFALGPASMHGAPGFADPRAEPADLTIGPESPAYGNSIAITIDLPDGSVHEIPAGFNVGAHQPAGAYERIDGLFGFLPGATSVPEARAKAEPETQEQPEQTKSLLLF